MQSIAGGIQRCVEGLESANSKGQEEIESGLQGKGWTVAEQERYMQGNEMEMVLLMVRSTVWRT